MSGLCKDCRWWKDLGPNGAEGYGECELARTEDGSTEHPENKDWKHLTQLAAGALEIGTYLLTREDFGCVQHEAKP